MKDKNTSFGKRLGRFFRKIVIYFFVISIGLTLVYKFVPVYFTPLMGIRAFQAVGNGKKPRIEKTWVPIEKISHNMVQAVVASEDNTFMQHNGFSFKDIQIAIEQQKAGKRARGGSTISQQTAKNVFLWAGRSWIRKGLEAYFTVLIELFWSKERIMEVYLNVIEMGDGIYGVQAASEIYFNKDAINLNKSQAALIAVCLPNPRKFSPVHPSNYISRRKNKIVNLMGKIGQVNLKKSKSSKNSKKSKS